jgi:Replication protein/Transposase zinc-binding domain
LADQATEEDLRIQQWSLKKQLGSTMHKLWQDYHCAGDEEQALKWFKQYEQIRNCQAQWIGYRAACCGASTTPVAVPIGCNHRLCPLCAWHRSQVARNRIKTMFDRLTHPVLVTLTVPNKGTIRKHDFTLFRQKVRKFIAQHKEWLQGGVYSLETTYNRTEKTWHLHVHILADACSPLPSKQEKITLAGQRVYAFTAIKLKLEFDWLRLWGKGWGKQAGKTAGKMRKEGDAYDFESWVEAGRGARIKEFRSGSYQPIEGLSQKAIGLRTAWNRENRRVIDIRSVTDREGAAYEVLKYLTKVADFSDVPEAVEAFANAVKGARLIQTFGTWYGVKLDTSTDFDPENFEDWGEMKCTCGVNHWERMGVFFRSDVEMSKEGRWVLKRHIEHTCGGTVPRPTIRALAATPEENYGEQLWQTR